MDENISKKLDEFCSKGNLEMYRDVLSEIFLKIINCNCEISARYDSDISSHSADDENGCRIRISLSKKYKSSIHIIWTILHEYGHHLIGPLSKLDENKFEKRRENELKAWDKALNEFFAYDKLKGYKDDFDNYRDECLNSYN